VAIGTWSGRTQQGNNAVAVGSMAGSSTQGVNAAAFGYRAGNLQQGIQSVAIGNYAGNSAQGAYAVAIGSQAGETSQPANSIIINANNTALNAISEGFYVRPIRTTASVINTYLAYDEPTKEIQYKTLNAAAVGLGSVTNTSDTDKPVSTATQTALDLKAPLASPSLTGTPSAPTATAGTNTTQLATTAFVASAVADLVGAAPATLDTLKELADALNNDASFNTTLVTNLGLKAPLASPTFTGTVSGITKSMVDLSNVDNTSDAAKPVSTATQTALDAKAPLANPAFTGTVTGITPNMVGFSINLDNKLEVVIGGATYRFAPTHVNGNAL